MKISMTGYKGRVGKYLLPYGYTGLDCDITRPETIRQALNTEKPNVVLHLAGKSNVDWCEDVAHQEQVIQTNFRGTNHVAEECEKLGIQMVFLSTDHVFSGKRWVGKYKESDKLDPANYYGLNKASAETLLNLFPDTKIIRTSYLFDRERIKHLDGDYPTFMKRSFIHFAYFAKMVDYYLKHYLQMPKILHLAGSDTVSWFKFAKDTSIVLEYSNIVNITPKHFDSPEFTPRGHNLGLSVKLAESLGFGRHSYMDGLKYAKRFG